MDKKTLDDVPVPVVILSATNGVIIHVNPAFQRTTGYSPDTVPPVPEWLRFASFNGTIPAWSDLASDLDRESNRATVQCSDGSEVLVDVRAAPKKNGPIVLTFSDAPDLHSSALTFAGTRPASGPSYNRALFETLPIGLALCRMDGSLVDVNQAYADILGRTIDETLVLSYWDITPRRFEPQEGEQLQRLNEKHHYGPYEKTYLHKDGHEVPVRLQGELLTLGAETFIWSSAEDISDRVQAEAALAESVRVAEAANKAKTNFLANMSHELRTPLNAVIGFGEFLLANPVEKLSEKQNEYVDHIVSAGRHLLELVNDVLDISKVEAGEAKLNIKDVCIADLINDCMELSAPGIESRHLSITNLSAGKSNMLVRGDETRLKQVLLNLISNASKYNKDSGAIAVDVEREKGTTIRVSVSDTGIGIPAHLHKRVFEPFDRLDPKTANTVEGTGVGLTVCKKLIERMGGTIGFESIANQGSLFWFTLPSADQAPSADTERQNTRNVGK